MAGRSCFTATERRARAGRCAGLSPQTMRLDGGVGPAPVADGFPGRRLAVGWKETVSFAKTLKGVLTLHRVTSHPRSCPILSLWMLVCFWFKHLGTGREGLGQFSVSWRQSETPRRARYPTREDGPWKRWPFCFLAPSQVALHEAASVPTLPSIEDEIFIKQCFE